MLKLTAKISLLIIAGLCFVPSLAHAASAANISKGYVTKEPLRSGMLVSLVEGTDNQVQASSIESEKGVIGVVVGESNGLLSLTSPQSNVQVVSDETAAVLVSDINGQVSKGDYVAVTNIKGVAGKVASENNFVVGVALEDSSAQDNTAGNMSVTKKDGSLVDTRVSLISVQLGVRTNTFTQSPNKSFVISVGESVVGRPVSLAQSVFASILLVVSFGVSGVLLSSSVRGSFVSLGRNPMAIKLIQRNLLKTSLISGVVLAAGIGIAYMILLF